MKKLKLVMVAALALIIFAGCKKETQKEFTSALAKQAEMNAGDYSIVIDKVSIKAEDADAPTRTSMEMASKMISGTKISGDYLKDSKKNLLAMNMEFDALGQKIPIEFFSDQKNKSVYLSTEFLTEATEIAKEFGKEIPINDQDLKELQGKYVHITEEDMKKTAEGKTSKATISGNIDSKLFSDYLDTLDSDSFEKTDDTIKRTFTKKDIQGFIKYAKENGNKDEKKAAKDFEKNIDQLTKYEQTTTLTTKKNTQKTTLKLAAKSDGATVTADLTMNNQAKDSKKKIQLPKKADTVSMEKIEEILSSAQSSSALISETDFNDLLEAIRSSGSQLTQTQIDQIKRTYKPYLTEEQYKQLEEALDQTSQMAA